MKHNLGGTEEKRIDLVEISLVTLEDLCKGRSVIGRSARRHFGADLLEQGIFGLHPENHAPPIQNRIVRAANCFNLSACDWRERSRAATGDYLGQVKLQLVKLV